jgi:hypothetical protein
MFSHPRPNTRSSLRRQVVAVARLRFRPTRRRQISTFSTDGHIVTVQGAVDEVPLREAARQRGD